MKDKIEQCIQAFIDKDFREYSKDFLNEEDIRAVLFTRLKDDLKLCRRTFPFEDLPSYTDKSDLNTDLVKSEYSYEDYVGKSCQTFDIAILHDDPNIWISKDDWSKHRNRQRVAQMYWNQPVRFGIEIKAAWHDWDIERRVLSVKDDRDKLKKYMERAYYSKVFQEKGTSLLFDGVAILFSSHEVSRDYFTPADRVKLGPNCDAFCITPTKVFKIE